MPLPFIALKILIDPYYETHQSTHVKKVEKEDHRPSFCVPLKWMSEIDFFIPRMRRIWVTTQAGLQFVFFTCARDILARISPIASWNKLFIYKVIPPVFAQFSFKSSYSPLPRNQMSWKFGFRGIERCTFEWPLREQDFQNRSVAWFDRNLRLLAWDNINHARIPFSKSFQSPLIYCRYWTIRLGVFSVPAYPVYIQY